MDSDIPTAHNEAKKGDIANNEYLSTIIIHDTKLCNN